MRSSDERQEGTNKKWKLGEIKKKKEVGDCHKWALPGMARGVANESKASIA